jgi:hypothetical protein
MSRYHWHRDIHLARAISGGIKKTLDQVKNVNSREHGAISLVSEQHAVNLVINQEAFSQFDL